MTNRQAVVGVAVIRADRVLAALRPGPDGGWEFPGGKVEPGEGLADAGARELREEFGVEVDVGAALGPAVVINEKYVLHVHVGRLVAGEPVPREHADLRWLSADQLDDVAWLAPDQPFVELLRAEMTRIPGR